MNYYDSSKAYETEMPIVAVPNRRTFLPLLPLLGGLLPLLQGTEINLAGSASAVGSGQMDFSNTNSATNQFGTGISNNFNGFQGGMNSAYNSGYNSGFNSGQSVQYISTGAQNGAFNSGFNSAFNGAQNMGFNGGQNIASSDSKPSLNAGFQLGFKLG